MSRSEYAPRVAGRWGYRDPEVGRAIWRLVYTGAGYELQEALEAGQPWGRYRGDAAEALEKLSGGLVDPRNRDYYRPMSAREQERE